MWNQHIEQLFKNYKRLLEERLGKYRLLHIGEDSIRYDFFAALMETYSLKPSQIQLEVPINAQCFVPLAEAISFRKEKPLIDLVVTEPELSLSAEFGLFRQNSNEKGTINKTARVVKMLNDMIRVSLETFFTGTMGYFICVADHKMLGHQMRNKIIERFPSNYQITNTIIERQLQERTNGFDKRFLKIFQPMNRHIQSKLIVNELLQATQIKHETRLLVWNVALA